MKILEKINKIEKQFDIFNKYLMESASCDYDEEELEEILDKIKAGEKLNKAEKKLYQELKASGIV